MHGFTEIFVWGGSSVAMAIAGLFIVKRYVSAIHVDVRSNMDFLVAVVAIVGTLVSVVLGLLVSSAVDQYRGAISLVDQEATSVVDIFRMSRGLPPKTATLMQHLCIDYCDKAVSEEWPAMERRQISNDLTLIGIKMNDAAVSFRPANDGETNVQSSILSALTEAVHCRRSRVVVLFSDWTMRMMPILIMCSGIILVIAYIYIDKKPTKEQVLLMSFIAIALGSNIGLMVAMSRPFGGREGVTSELFERNAKLLRELEKIPVANSQ